jgi:hypothetical protein
VTLITLALYSTRDMLARQNLQHAQSLIARHDGQGLKSQIMAKHFCPHCKEQIDPDWCWCGNHMDHHTQSDNHSPIPMGCTCYFDKENYDG